MTTDELRQRFLKFFASKNHKIYPSDSLVPKEDPTLLFTSAGMNQFKREFLGGHTKFVCRATCQKCLRTGDLDKVGKTNFHHTFFEMLGNFSFGGYFKEKAIAFAWEFVSEALALSKEKLWVSVYKEDQEAYDIWKEKIKIAGERIVKLGAKENFWPANAPIEGPDGPCGPCSEIFYDLGKDFGCGRPECNPACSCSRFVEVWNLVFTQFDRQGENNLLPLPKKNIDTGMGLERMAAVLQGAPNNFEIDTFRPITEEIVRLASLSGDKLESAQLCARNAIADHIRAITFAVAEGILPSNDERGYVIRKLIRRAVWHGRSLGIEKPYLYKIIPSVARAMKAGYPELEKRREEIAQVVLAEEKRFRETLQRAVAFAKEIIAGLTAQGKSEIPGEAAFKLYDTYGLPQEMLESIVGWRGFKLDRKGFARELEFQRNISRKAAAFETSVFVGTLASTYKLKPTKFVGEKKLSANTRVCALFRDKDDQPLKEAKQGETIKLVLETTPFYGESGGLVGDTGLIKNKNAKIRVFDTKKIDRTIVHLGELQEGAIKVNAQVEAAVDAQRRSSIAWNHTATHLLQAVLRKVLGEHVRQAGSWVGPDRLRFDFTHFQALTRRQLQRVEELVNNHIKQNKKVDVLKMSFEQSQKLGALAFFGEKYQEQVRAVKIGDVSLELCGGAHASSSGELKLFKIIGESSVASGIRRIEATTAAKARELLKEEKNQLMEFAQTFGGSQEELPRRIEGLLGKVKKLERRLEALRLQNFKSKVAKIVADAREIKGVKIIAQEIKSADMKLLRLMADLLKQKASPCAVVLASVWEQRALMVCALTAQLRPRGLDAANIIRAIALDVDGSGGGRADFAQAGGSGVRGLKKALMKAQGIIEKELKDNEGN